MTEGQRAQRLAERPIRLQRRISGGRLRALLLAALASCSVLIVAFAIPGFAMLVATPFIAPYLLFTGTSPAGYVRGALWVVLIVGVGAVLCYLPVLIATAARGGEIVLTNARATPPEPLQLQRLKNVVDEMAVAAGIPSPGIAVIRQSAPNAMAAGASRRPTIAVSPSVLDLLDRQQLQAVVAHEIAHVVNGDIRFSTFLAAIFVRFDLLIEWARPRRGNAAQESGNRRGNEIDVEAVLSILFRPGLHLGRLFARATGLGAARQREFLADETAVRLTRDPQALIDALLKLAHANYSGGSAEGLAHLFIVDPFDAESTTERLMASHPPLAQRVDRLNQLKRMVADDCGAG